MKELTYFYLVVFLLKENKAMIIKLVKSMKHKRRQSLYIITLCIVYLTPNHYFDGGSGKGFRI